MPVMPGNPATNHRLESYPSDPDFPQLEIATDPERMLEVFRKHLKPVSPDSWRIQECVPFRFRFRQGTSRCVLQYTLRLIEPVTGRTRQQWVTGILYTGNGQTERLYQEMQEDRLRPKVPNPWLTFDPVCFVPKLQMLVTLFPYDRKLHALSRLLSGPPPDLAALLLTRFGPGDWRVKRWDVEPLRYCTELCAALRYTGTAREVSNGVTIAKRFYLKVHREQRSERTFRLLSALSAASGQGDFHVVRPIAHLAPLHSLVLEEAPGISLQELILRGGDAVAASARVARAVAAFNQSDLPATRPYPLDVQRAQLDWSAQLIGWACPHLRLTVKQIAAAAAAGLEEVPRAPIHRDLKPDHVFLQDDRVTLVDLECLSLADPMMDPAHMMSYLTARVGLDSVPFDQARAAANAFADEYCAHVPAGWRRRLPIHYAAALIDVAAGIFRRQEPHWAQKMGEAVEEAGRALSGAPGSACLYPSKVI